MRTSLLLAPILVATTAAADPSGVYVEPRAGAIVSTSKLGPSVIGGLAIDYGVAAEHRFLIGVDVSITQPSHDGTVMDPRIPMTGTYTLKETELELALLASYRFADMKASFVPWAGAGPMIHMLRSTETTNLAPGDNTAQSTEAGVEVAGGADFRAGPGYLAGDVRFAYTKLDHQLTGSTNAGKVAIAIGYRFVF